MTTLSRRSALSGAAAVSVAALSGIPAAQAETPNTTIGQASGALGASILALYKKPANTAAFDSYYSTHHAPLAKTLPGLQSYTLSRALTDKDPYYLVAILTFPSMDAVKSALGSPQGKAVVDDLKNFAQAGVQVLAFENVPA
jgi:uncharacterized protein (TIGR02118 family)